MRKVALRVRAADYRNLPSRWNITPEPPIMPLTRYHGSHIKQSRQSLSRRKYLFVRFRREYLEFYHPG
jgi:hypothetical protein